MSFANLAATVLLSTAAATAATAAESLEKPEPASEARGESTAQSSEPSFTFLVAEDAGPETASQAQATPAQPDAASDAAASDGAETTSGDDAARSAAR